MNRRPLRLAAAGLAAAGLAALGIGLYMPAKAALAQVLMHRAWAETQATGKAHRPWPWADTHPVARMTAPRLGADLIVLAGANGRALAFGPAHMESAALPGAPGHAVVAGHRDTHFAFLRHVTIDDRFLIEGRDGERRAYRVVDARVADARTARIDLADRRDRLTLVTCYPFDAVTPGGPLRWVVTADAEAPLASD